jgi:hypothetical protein
MLMFSLRFYNYSLSITLSRWTLNLDFDKNIYSINKETLMNLKKVYLNH